MHLGRAPIRLTVEGDRPTSGGPPRGCRRIEWIELALEPVRRDLPRKEFDRLVSALSVLIGWEPLVVLKDLRGLACHPRGDRGGQHRGRKRRAGVAFQVPSFRQRMDDLLLRSVVAHCSSSRSG